MTTQNKITIRCLILLCSAFMVVAPLNSFASPFECTKIFQKNQIVQIEKQEAKQKPLAVISTSEIGFHANEVLITSGAHYPLSTVVKFLGFNGISQMVGAFKGESVLSVGEGLSPLVPSLVSNGINATALDIWYGNDNLPPELQKYVTNHQSYLLAGSSDHIPLPDKSVKFVLSHGLINNIPGELILPSIAEMLRVTSINGQVRMAFCCTKLDDLLRSLREKYKNTVSIKHQFFRDKWRFQDRKIEIRSELVIINRLE